MDKYKDGDMPEHVISRIPVTTLYRWFMYDLKTKKPNDHIDVFGLTPVSEEGDEKERQESEERLDNILELTPFLTMFADMTATYVIEMQKCGMVEIPDLTSLTTNGDKIKSFYRRLAYSALLTSYASAVELGLVDASQTYTDIS